MDFRSVIVGTEYHNIFFLMQIQKFLFFQCYKTTVVTIMIVRAYMFNAGADFYARKQSSTTLVHFSHRHSVCPSFTWVDQSKMVQARITKSTPSAAWKTFTCLMSIISNFLYINVILLPAFWNSLNYLVLTIFFTVVTWVIFNPGNWCVCPGKKDIVMHGSERIVHCSAAGLV